MRPNGIESDTYECLILSSKTNVFISICIEVDDLKTLFKRIAFFVYFVCFVLKNLLSCRLAF